MKNKVILSVVLLIAMVLGSYSVLAVKNINITAESLSITGSSGSQAGIFTVKNIGDEQVNVSLIIVNQLIGPQGKTITMTDLNITPGTINPNNIATGQFVVNLDNAVMGQYTGLLQAQVQDSSASDFLVVSVNVTDNGQSFIVISPSTNASYADTTVYQTVKVQNNANKDINLVIAKEGYDGMIFNADRIGSQAIPAFGTLDVAANVVVPANKATGMYTARINATDGTNTRTANLAISVLPTYKVGASDFTISSVDPGSMASVSFSLQNTGNLDLTSLSISNYTLIDASGNKINLTFSPGQGINIPVGSSAAITASADVSGSLASGPYSQQVTVNGMATKTFTANVQVNSLLQITDVVVDPDELMPGEEFDVEVTIENMADEMDLRDVEVEVFIMDGNSILQDDDDDDLKDTADVGDFNNGDEEKVTLRFTMPYNTEDGDSYTIKAVARGKNDDNTKQKFEYIDTSQTIDVTRDDHKVDIYNAELESSTLSCSRTTYINVGLKDIGANDETVILTIKNDQLGIRMQDNFDMSSDYDDDEFDVEKSYQLDFTSTPTGTYPVTIIAENDDGDKLGDETISVNIQDCSSITTPTTPSTPTTPTTPTTTGTTSNIDVVYGGSPSGMTGAVTVPAVSAASSISRAKKGSWTDSTLGTAVLILGNLLLVLLVIIAVMYLVGNSGSKKDSF